VSFTDLSTNSPTSWSWTVSPASGWTYTGGTSASSQNPQIQFNTAGTYTVALTASNGSGSDTETKTNYITVTSSGGASIDENDLSKVVIYPNPTNGTINVNFTNVTATIESVELRDITGRIIAKDAVLNGEASFDLTHEAAGVYFIKINGEVQSLTKKVVKF
jgi:PKD repeat protein